MKVIKYKVLGYMHKYNIETDTIEKVECLCEAEKPYSEANVELVKEEAYKGEYTIEDKPTVEPTADELLNALLGVTSYE